MRLFRLTGAATALLFFAGCSSTPTEEPQAAPLEVSQEVTQAQPEVASAAPVVTDEVKASPRIDKKKGKKKGRKKRRS